jgi:3-oxoacyl-(acyl-carrier-protein) synthase
VIAIRGMGWVTPMGANVEEGWARLMTGETAEARPLTNPETGRIHPHFPIPPKMVDALGKNPRLRRSSPISYFAAAAGLAAVAEAGWTVEQARGEGLAVIFAVSTGSVLYTRRMYEQVVKQGANAASPMLFPETVYNAPASHLSALLGIDEASYTLVGDNSVGLAALKMAEQLLAIGSARACLVVGTEEIDWVLCEGYRDWRFTTRDMEARVYGDPARGAILAEGAAAVLVTPGEGSVTVRAIHDGAPFAARAEAPAALGRVCAELAGQGKIDCAIGSANGSFGDRIEAAALARHWPETPLCAPKNAWGENLGAGALQQVICAARALQAGELPPTPMAGARAPATLVREARRGLDLRQALVLCTGLNQQASGAVLAKG